MIETISSILVGIFLFLILWGRSYEKKRWNNGKCKCGGQWERFDTDSQGGRMYKCTRCENHVDISWPGVDRDYTND